ncbi:hypothetical protein GUJ93_ZPchr0009g535 [Zizania palustris]|uniref:Uncharacterized protein n=1 Tax=Zizania palustris TaxID=103762 RepID=A0A8J5RNE1_ZIZPA|nr:hypothetical protein GUJ93_ZPchr0009g535 [Zizania palustris]
MEGLRWRGLRSAAGSSGYILQRIPLSSHSFLSLSPHMVFAWLAELRAGMAPGGGGGLKTTRLERLSAGPNTIVLGGVFIRGHYEAYLERPQGGMPSTETPSESPYEAPTSSRAPSPWPCMAPPPDSRPRARPCRPHAAPPPAVSPQPLRYWQIVKNVVGPPTQHSPALRPAPVPPIPNSPPPPRRASGQRPCRPIRLGPARRPAAAPGPCSVATRRRQSGLRPAASCLCASASWVAGRRAWCVPAGCRLRGAGFDFLPASLVEWPAPFSNLQPPSQGVRDCGCSAAKGVVHSTF